MWPRTNAVAAYLVRIVVSGAQLGDDAARNGGTFHAPKILDCMRLLLVLVIRGNTERTCGEHTDDSRLLT